jgi:hypothetical protein
MDKTMIAPVPWAEVRPRPTPACGGVARGFEPDGAMAGRGVRRIEVSTMTNSKSAVLSPRR